MVLRLQHNRCHGMGLFPPLHLRLCSWRRYMGGNHMGFLTYSWNDILVKSGVSWHDKVRVCKGYQLSNCFQAQCIQHKKGNLSWQAVSKLFDSFAFIIASFTHPSHWILLRVECHNTLQDSLTRRLSVWVMWKSDEIGACSSRLLRRVRSLLCNGDNAEAVVKHSYLCKMKNQAGLQELISRNINIV